MQQLKQALDFHTWLDMLKAKGEERLASSYKAQDNLAAILFNDQPSVEHQQLLADIAQSAALHHFFQYPIAFPEVFHGDNAGFDVVIGNPPWDKTKFADSDFFPRYKSNYRSLRNH